MQYKPNAQLTARLAAFFAEHNFTSFAWVPTDNTVPNFRVQDNVVMMGHVDLSPANVCDMQLRAILTGYRRLLSTAQAQLTTPAMARNRIERDALFTMLEAWQHTHAEAGDLDIPDWLRAENDMDDLPDFVGDMFDSLTSDFPFGSVSMKQIVMPPPDVLSVYSDVTKALGLDPMKWDVKDQRAFVRDLVRYNAVALEVAYAENLVKMLEQLIAALVRETESRETANQLAEQRRVVSQLRTQVNGFEALLRQNTIDSAVRALRCTGIKVGDQRELAIRDEYGDLADEILLALMDTEGESAPASANVPVPAEA